MYCILEASKILSTCMILFFTWLHIIKTISHSYEDVIIPKYFFVPKGVGN